MKKLNLTLSLLLILTLCSCNRQEKEITEAATGYLTALANYHIADAKPYATQETVETYIASLEQYIQPLLDTNELFRTNCMAATPATITIDNIEIKDDTIAMVTYTQAMPTGTSTGRTLEMRLRPEGWRAHFCIQETTNLVSRPVQKLEHPKMDNKKLRVVRDSLPKFEN